MQFTDFTCHSWSVEEHFPPWAVAGILVFSRPNAVRCSWGSPIDWRNPANLRVLFDLSVPAHAAA